MSFATMSDTSAADPDLLPALPAWVGAARADSPEETALRAGAALAHLHLLVHHAAVPQRLWRDRLAIQAAGAALAWTGRSEQVADIRDAQRLTRPGDLPGPAGAMGHQWSRCAARPATAVQGAQITGLPTDLVAQALAPGARGPVASVAFAIATILSAHPRSDVEAVMIGDLALARILRWPRAVPLLALGLARRALRDTGPALDLACLRAVVKAAPLADRDARALARRAAALALVAPKLRSKQSGAALELFLAQDGVAPWELTQIMSPRAARRLCDRLVALGVVRELTGRDSFRLYGL